MAAKKKKQDDQPAVPPSERTAQQRKAKTKQAAESIGSAIAQPTPKNAPKQKSSSGVRGPAAKRAAKRQADKRSQAESRARTERQANVADFLNDYFVDPQGNILGEDEGHEFTRLIQNDPERASEILSDYNLRDLPEDFAKVAFGPGYVPPQYEIDEKTGEETDKLISGPSIQEIVSVEGSRRRDIDDISVDEYDPSQDPDYSDPERRRYSGFDLGDVLGSEGLTDVNTAEQQALSEEGKTYSDDELGKYTDVPRGLGPLTRGRIHTSAPSTGAPQREGLTNTPRTVIRRRRGGVLQPQQVDALINALGPTKMSTERRLVDPNKVDIVMSSQGDVEVPMVEEEEAARATKADKQSILTRDEVWDLANRGALASPTASNRVPAMVQISTPQTPEEVATPDAPANEQYIDLGVQSVASHRREARKDNEVRGHLGTVIAKLAAVRNRAGLTYWGRDQRTVTDADTGTRKTIQVPRKKTVFEGTTISTDPRRGRAGNTDFEGPEAQRLTPSTIEALQKAGWSGIFGGSLTQGGARIGRPQGEPLSGTREGRRVDYDVDPQGNIYESTPTPDGPSTRVRTDISMRRADYEDPDAPLEDADLVLSKPLDTSIVDPMSSDYEPLTQGGLKWSEVADYPGQVDEIRATQAAELAKTEGSGMSQSLREGRTSLPRGVKKLRKAITERRPSTTPGPTKIVAATRKTGVGPGIKKAAKESGMDTEAVVESMRKMEGYKNLVQMLARPSGVSAYKERIFESTTRPGGVAPTDFPTQRMPVKTNRGGTSSVGVQAPTSGKGGTLSTVLDRLSAAQARKTGEGFLEGSPEEKAVIRKLGIDPDTGKLGAWYTPTPEETAAADARTAAAKAADLSRVRSDRAKAVKRRLGAPNPAEVDAAKVKSLREATSPEVHRVGAALAGGRTPLAAPATSKKVGGEWVQTPSPDTSYLWSRKEMEGFEALVTGWKDRARMIDPGLIVGSRVEEKPKFESAQQVFSREEAARKKMGPQFNR